jgi:hypothetical protein
MPNTLVFRAHSAFRLSSWILGCALLSSPAHAAGKKAKLSSDQVVLPPPPEPVHSWSPSRPATTHESLAPSADAGARKSSSDATPTQEDDPRFKVAALLGYSTNDLNLGLGVRAGKNLFMPHLYVGGTFVYQLGHSVSASAAGTQIESSISAYYLGPEVGYDFYFAPVVLRVYAGLGVAGLTASASVAGTTAVSETVTKFVVWPGAMVIYDLPDSNFFLAADTRFVTVPGGPAIGFFALGGMKF